MSALEDLLRAATLKLESRVPDRVPKHAGEVIKGTGFLVAPGIVATCAHVLAQHREELPGTVAARTATGRELVLNTVPEWYLRERKGGRDLAFLPAPLDTGPHVLLCDTAETDETLWTWGHPAGPYRAGQSALFTAQGAARLRAVDADGRPLGDEWQPERVFGTPVGGGYSGSAVLRRRTGGVCGMLFSAGKEGSAHMVSAADILAALAQIGHAKSELARNTRWLEELDDEQIRLGGWTYPGPRLRSYLDAAIFVAREHPYPGVVPGTRPPPLTTVHLRQQAQPSQNDALAAPPAEAAQEILDRDGDAVVIAGPGGGKSTLLRTGLITLAERWRAEQSGRWIPVLVPAADLTPPRPLHEALADSVTKGLNTAASEHDWPPQMFNTEPLRGVRWLVMADGLDEIADPEQRHALITKLANASARPGSPYRCVATTRPLHAGELAEQSSGGWPARRYELLPFAPEDLDRFVGQWFTARNLPRPEYAARDFIGELQRLGLDSLARTPLMATMLCQLRIAHPKRPLPKSRGRIYQDFVDLLYQRQRKAGLRAQTRAALQECGQGALDAADRTLEHLHDLIAVLASNRHAGGTTPALDLIAAQLDAARPKLVPEAEWTTVLSECLRSSGLLTLPADEAVFLHPTLLEFLAARHATRDEPARVEAYQTLHRQATDAPPSGPSHGGPESRFWWDSRSFVGFLIDLGYAENTDSARILERVLIRLATQGARGMGREIRELAGGEFIASLTQLRTRLPDTVVEAAANTLSELICSPHLGFNDRADALGTLARLDDQRGVDALAQLAHDTNLASEFPRMAAAQMLARLGDQRGVELLAQLAQDTDLVVGYRVQAAEDLAGLGDQRGVDALAQLAHDTNLEGMGRVWAVRTLAGLGDQRGVELLTELAQDTDLFVEIRVRAAEELAGLGDPRGVDALAQLAQDKDLAIGDRMWAAIHLAELNNQHANADLLAQLAQATDLDIGDRVRAAQHLTLLDDQRGVPALAQLAQDTDLVGYIRGRAAEHLAGLGDQRGVDALAQLAQATDFAIGDRMWAAELLADGQRGVDALAQLAQDTDLDIGDRMWAVTTLTRPDVQRGVPALAQLAQDTDLAGDIRVRAAEHLARLGDQRGVNALAQLAHDTNLAPRIRMRAVEHLADGQHTNADLLAQLAQDTDLEVDHRMRAVRALARLGDQRGVDALAQLAHDTNLAPRIRMRAAEHLADGQHANADLLAQLAQDTDLAIGDRLWAAEQLAELDDHQGVDALAQLAHDTNLARRIRMRAAEQLAGLGDQRGNEPLAQLAQDTDLVVGHRVWAVRTLAGLGDQRGVELLTELAQDTDLFGEIRVRAAEELAGLGDPRGVDALAQLAQDTDLAIGARMRAAEHLAELDDQRATDLLDRIAGPTNQDRQGRA